MAVVCGGLEFWPGPAPPPQTSAEVVVVVLNPRKDVVVHQASPVPRPGRGPPRAAHLHHGLALREQHEAVAALRDLHQQHRL